MHTSIKVNGSLPLRDNKPCGMSMYARCVGVGMQVSTLLLWMGGKKKVVTAMLGNYGSPSGKTRKGATNKVIT